MDIIRILVYSSIPFVFVVRKEKEKREEQRNQESGSVVHHGSLAGLLLKVPKGYREGGREAGREGLHPGSPPARAPPPGLIPPTQSPAPGSAPLRFDCRANQ